MLAPHTRSSARGSRDRKISLPSELLVKTKGQISQLESSKTMPPNYNKVYSGIYLANGETVKDAELLRRLKVSHVLNAAEGEVRVSPTELAMYGIQYRGFHVEDIPTADISRYFLQSVPYIHDVVSGGGTILVNCFRGLSRSASCVLAYLIKHQRMTLDQSEWNDKMPWQPFSPDSPDKHRRRPSYLGESDRIEDNGVKSPAKLYRNPSEPTERAERRVKEKSSYKKLIANLQSTYQDLTQEQALRGILALRVENNGTLSGMTMLEITEGVMKFVKANYKINISDEEDNSSSKNINSDDADGENSSIDDTASSSERKLEVEESGRRAEILRVPRVPTGPNHSSSESDGDHSSDDSYSPDKEVSPQRKRFSPKKKSEHDPSPEKTPQKPRGPRKKIDKVQLSLEDIEAEYPKMCRKRKFPSHFHEFSLPHPEPEDPDDKQETFHLNQKYKQSKKKKNETEDKENHNSGNTETSNGDMNQPEASDQGQCGLCGFRFDDNSKKVEMTEKTRETGQTFADMLYGLFQDESLPPSLAEKAKSIELDDGYLCTLCVSYVDQMDVFQKKLSEIRSSILDVFIQKTKREGTQCQVKSVQLEEKVEPKVPKKRGRPPKPKSEKIVTQLHQSPPKKPENIELNSEEISEPPQLADEESDNLAHKLSILSGIEIKRVNTETGEESEAKIGKEVERKGKKKSPIKKPIPLSAVSDSSFSEACETLEDELSQQTVVNTPEPSVRSNVSSRGRRPTSARGRGQGRGRGRGTGTPVAFTPQPPPAKSKKSLFELSQERRRQSQGTPQYIVNGIQLSPSPSLTDNTLYSVAVTPPAPTISPTTPSQTPEELKQKRAYRKLVARIQGVHPELTTDETIQGIIAVRDSNNGTLTGMSMQEIISRVRESVLQQSVNSGQDSAAPPIGEEFEAMVFAPLREEETVQQNDITKLFELKCQFCSRMFKSSSEVATQKVYEIHLQEHENENRNLYEEINAEKENGEADTDVELVRSDTNTPEVEHKSSTENTTEHKAEPLESPVVNADPIRSEISYCKICKKQFKNCKLYGIHQNTEHAAEKEFEKISHSS